MSSYQKLVISATQRLRNSDVAESSAKYLMYELLSEKNIDMYLHYDDEADPEIESRFTEGIERLLQEEPMAYILGYQWFYGRKIRTHQEVFIPRYETEELCGEVLSIVDEYFPEGKVCVADLCCGSGAIAITLAAEEERCQVYASDLSQEAVSVAEKSALDNGVQVHFMQGDFLNPLKEAGVKLDILVCNPPYIVDDEVLDVSVKDFEPHMALFGGKDGLDFYRRLFREAEDVLKEKSVIACEIGYNQREALLALAKEHFPVDRAEVLQDLNGKDRMFFLYHNL